jgi:ketosteroid isomerase-like protein
MKFLYRFLLMALLMPVFTGCHRTPDEVQIRQAIEKAAQATEQIDASAVLDPLTDDFDGNRGTMARQDIGNLLRAAKFRGETLHALVGPVDVQSRGERYVASFTVTLSSGGKLFPSQLGAYQVETAWRREGRHWRCYSATWTQQF